MWGRGIGAVALLMLLAGCRIAAQLDPFYEAVLSARPDHPGALYLQGQHLIDQGRFEEAEAYFARMTRVAPDEPAGWVGLGQAQLEHDRARAAERSFRRALDLGAEHLPHARLGLISSLLLQGKVDPARAELEQFEQRRGVSSATERLRGDLAFVRNDFEEAASRYRSSLSMDANQPAIRGRLAELERYLAVRQP